MKTALQARHQTYGGLRSMCQCNLVAELSSHELFMPNSKLVCVQGSLSDWYTSEQDCYVVNAIVWDVICAYYTCSE